MSQPSTLATSPFGIPSILESYIDLYIMSSNKDSFLEAILIVIYVNLIFYLVFHAQIYVCVRLYSDHCEFFIWA